MRLWVPNVSLISLGILFIPLFVDTVVDTVVDTIAAVAVGIVKQMVSRSYRTASVLMFW